MTLVDIFSGKREGNLLFALKGALHAGASPTGTSVLFPGLISTPHYLLVSFRPQETMPAKMPKSNKRNRSKKGGKAKGIPATFQIMPPAYRRAYMTYTDASTLTEAAAWTGNHYTWRLNSIFDPNFTGVGSTAWGYTSITAMYALFRVVRVRVIARLSLATSGQAIVGLMPGMNSTYSASYLGWQAQPNCISKTIQGNAGGEHSIANFDVTFDLAKLAGITPSQYQTDFDFAHAAGSNPTRNLYVSAFLAGQTTGAAQTAIYNVRLIYEVELSQPLQTVTA